MKEGVAPWLKHSSNHLSNPAHLSHPSPSRPPPRKSAPPKTPGTPATLGKVSLAYTPDSRWRNRTDFFAGRPAIVDFLTQKWQRELEYRLIKELWGTRENRIAVRFVYESHDANGQWFRSFGNELWEFDPAGLMRIRQASINDLPIAEADRRFRWPLGPRPLDHPGLTKLNL